MPQILRTVLIPDEPQAADGPQNYDLPVNPLSGVLLTVQALNDTAVIANYGWLVQLLAMITDVRIAYRGASVIQGNLLDLAALYGCLSGWSTFQGVVIETDNNVRHVTVPLLFGRKPYDPSECFPATRRGDLVMTLNYDVATPGFDGLIIQAETIELLEAQPTQFCKVTTTSKLNNAVNEHDIELPIGNDLLGVMLFSALVPSGVVRTAQFGSVALEVDNVETIIAESRWETMRADFMRRYPDKQFQPHTHGFQYDPTLAAIQQARTREQEQTTSQWLQNYAYLDFDPMMDGSYALKTAGAARVNLRVQTEVASAVPLRALPIELVPIAGTQAAA